MATTRRLQERHEASWLAEHLQDPMRPKTTLVLSTHKHRPFVDPDELARLLPDMELLVLDGMGTTRELSDLLPPNT